MNVLEQHSWTTQCHAIQPSDDDVLVVPKLLWPRICDLANPTKSIGVREGRSIQRSIEVVQILLFTSFWLMNFLYLARILFLKGCGGLFWKSTNSTNIFNGLQHSFQVWQGFIIISESFSYKDSLFILATKRKEDFRINSTFISFS
jgi:hypothetical protein